MVGRFIRITLQAIGLIAVVVVVTAAVMLPFLGAWLQPQDTPERAEYIVVLGGDEHRHIKAAEIYKQGFAPTVLISNDRVPPKSRLQQAIIELGYPNVHPLEIRRRIIEHFGVPRSAIGSFGDGSVSTLEEAEAFKKFVNGRPVTAILVTSPFHARRAKLTFESVMPKARFLIVSPPEGTIDGRWWRDQQSAIWTGLEAMKLAYFWLGGAFRTAAAGGNS